ncbi:MAG: Ig-like domain-containing protein, partial [Parvularculaceae bacterium]
GKVSRDCSLDWESSASIFTLRVDGALDFATDRDTFLEVDTFIVTPTGHLTIGTIDNPVAADVEAVISIASNGPIDVAWDPMLLSRGLISHGSIEINGAEKETFIRLAADPMAGDASLLLDSPPDGWRVGDRLVLTGTHLTNGASADPTRKDVTTEDEELVITRIEGNRIYVDRPLQYDHEGARSDLKAYVANMTRNIRIQSEDGDATPTHERGHVMFMHSDNIDVRYAEFYELGRTDKSERAFDVGDLATVESDSNVKARYPLHIHRAGVADLDDPVMLVGNAVWGSPGWGVVHHDSNAIVANNAAYDIYGAAFVAETGNETGRWTENIAIKSIGVDHLIKDGGDVGAFDLGRTGVGFWFQGRLVDAVGNVAAGMPSGHGYVYMHRIPNSDQLYVDPETVMQSDTMRYVDDAFIYQPNINKFYDNEVIAALYGVEVVKPGPQQMHDVRSVFEDFTAWEVHTGVLLQYTGHYTLKNIDLVGTDSDLPWRDTSIGIRYFTNVFDTVVNGADIHGFATGVYLDHSSLFDGVTNFRYIFIDTEITGALTPYVGLTSSDRLLTSADLVDRPLTYESAWGDGIIHGPMGPHDSPFVLNGTKTDSLGTTETSTDWDPFTISYWNIRGAVEENGYWRTADGRRVTLIEEYVADRATGEIEKFSVFVEVPTAMSFTPYQNYEAVRVAPEFHGVFDPTSLAPVGVADSYTVHAGEEALLNVLANDFDPEGDTISLDGFTAPDHGHLVQNEDGALVYFADPGFSGVDSFAYWVEDEQGNFTKTAVTVTVEI